MHQLSKFRMIIFIFSLSMVTNCSPKKDTPSKNAVPLKKTTSLKVETPLKKEEPLDNEFLKNDSYWKSDAYRLHFRVPYLQKFASHPLTTGVFLAIGYIRGEFGTGEKYPEQTYYPRTIHIYKNENLNKVVGELLLTKKNITYENGLKDIKFDAVLKIGKSKKCEYIKETIPGWVEYLDNDMENERENCLPLHIFDAMMEVNRIHSNSYEIFQGDGTSLFIDKKEIEPLVYYTSLSNNEVLKELGYKGKDIKAIYDALQLAIDEVRNSSFKGYRSKYKITSFGVEHIHTLSSLENDLSKQFETIKADVAKHFPKFYNYRAYVMGDKIIFHSGRPAYLLLGGPEGDDSGYMYGSAFTIILNKDKKFVPSGHVVFYSSNNRWGF